MTDYLKPKFTVAVGQTERYRDEHARIFGERKPAERCSQCGRADRYCECEPERLPCLDCYEPRCLACDGCYCPDCGCACPQENKP